MYNTSILPTITSPCKGCADREIGCHGKCKRYAGFTERLEQIRKAKDKKVADNNVLYGGGKHSVFNRYGGWTQ